MFGSKALLGVVLIGTLVGVAQADSVTVVSPRQAMLQREAARVEANFGAPAPTGFTPWVGGAFLLGLLASFAGTYAGLRLFAFGKLVERDGWREVTYRYRSSPLRVQSDTLAKMTTILEEIESLGTGVRRGLAAAAAKAPRTEAPPAERVLDRAPSVETKRPQPSAERRFENDATRLESRVEPRFENEMKRPEALAERMPVKFVRREEVSRSPMRERAPAPVVSIPAPASPVTPQDRARELLREGRDLASVQALTGLKRAELDLLQWSISVARAS